MHLLGHLGAAMTAYVLVRRGLRLRRTQRTQDPSLALAGLLALSTLPDVDSYVPGVDHRGVTHTVWFAVAAGVVVALVATAVDGRLGRGDARPSSDRRTAVRGFAVGAGAVLVHLAADAVTPMGVRPFAPFSDVGGSLSLVSAADPRANAAVFAAGVALVCADRWDAAERTTAARRLGRALRLRLPTIRGRT